MWSYLVGQYQARHGIDPDIPFALPEMLHQYTHETTPHEHTIQVDLGWSHALSQLEHFN